MPRVATGRALRSVQLPTLSVGRVNELVGVRRVASSHLFAVPAQGLLRAERDVSGQECLGKPARVFKVCHGRGASPGGVDPFVVVIRKAARSVGATRSLRIRIMSFRAWASRGVGVRFGNNINKQGRYSKRRLQGRRAQELVGSTEVKSSLPALVSACCLTCSSTRWWMR